MTTSEMCSLKPSEMKKFSSPNYSKSVYYPAIPSGVFSNKTSAPAIESNQLNLTFELSYSVRNGLFAKGKKIILSDVRGDFRSGELTAIMGPSGAGKSTLLDILAGFTTSGVSGKIYVNGKLRNLTVFRRSSAYVMQDDILQPLLTVQEAMQIAAELKLESNISSSDKKRNMDRILRGIGLDESRRTLTKNLSGGQRKRLAIALELIGNPPIMFFDEPTSGLDSVAAKQCVDLLKSLASKNRMIVCTIHQPSATLLDMMDHLYVVAKGHCAYAGAPSNLLSYLQKFQHECPTYHNPADFFLELLTEDHSDNLLQLIDAWKREDSNECWRRKSREEQNQDTLVLPYSTKQMYDCDSKVSAYYASSTWKQFRVLFRRNIIRISRDKLFTLLRISMHLFFALLIGIFFRKIGQKAAYTRDNYRLIFFHLYLVVFLAFDGSLLIFPTELPMLAREHFNRWYKLHSFYYAHKLADLPVQLAITFVYVSIFYELTDQIQDVKRFALYFFICLLVGLVSQTIGLILGTVLNIQNAVIIGTFTLVPPTLLSGVYFYAKDLNPSLLWLLDTSFIKYGFEGATISIYGFDRPRMKCDRDYCHLSSPKALLREVDMENSDYWFCAIVLVGFYVVLDVISYLALRLELKIRTHK